LRRADSEKQIQQQNVAKSEIALTLSNRRQPISATRRKKGEQGQPEILQKPRIGEYFMRGAYNPLKSPDSKK
jgi:hypothetical protein